MLTQDVQPPSRLRPELGIPAAVETLVMRAMEKDRDKRYQTMAELERDLERLLAGDPNVGVPPEELTPPAEPSRTGARWHLGIGAILITGVGLALALARTEEEARTRALRSTVVPAAVTTKQSPAPPRPPPPAAEPSRPPATTAQPALATTKEPDTKGIAKGTTKGTKVRPLRARPSAPSKGRNTSMGDPKPPDDPYGQPTADPKPPKDPYGQP